MSSSSSEVKLEDFRISLEEINSSTAYFSAENYVGGGGFGKVYKGKLSGPWGDGMVAIKQLNPQGWQGKHEFMNEVSMLYRYKHKNIVTFVGYCDEGNQMIIVYEYVVNGILDKHLCDTNKMQRLSWEQRLKICIGAAEGLNHLHSGIGADLRVIHRDVKSSNILLNENLEAKVADFGLAKFGPRNQQFTLLHTRVAGTDGYCDPHYYQTGELTKESDVYSFGVVLFEMLGGRLVFRKINCNLDHDDSRSLMDLVRQYYKDRLEKIIDPHIRDQIESKSLDTFKEIAYQCIKLNYKKRPEMVDVVRELKEALDSQVFRSGPECPRRYDVFLSYSRSNVGYTFVDHLHSTLHQKGFNPSTKTIKSSSFAIVIFSKKYAASDECLDELVEIMNRHEMMKITVLPVYYDVGPSEVRNQTGEFGEYLHDRFLSLRLDYHGAERELDMMHEQDNIWRKALKEAASICGWDLTSIANGNEAKCIQEIVESLFLTNCKP